MHRFVCAEPLRECTVKVHLLTYDYLIKMLRYLRFPFCTCKLPLHCIMKTNIVCCPLHLFYSFHNLQKCFFEFFYHNIFYHMQKKIIVFFYFYLRI